MKKIDILNFSYEELIEELSSLNLKKFVISQIYDWLHNKLEFDFDNFSNIKKEIREILKEKYIINNFKFITKQVSEDKMTSKYLFSINDKYLLESVLITHNNRKTLCVSSQVGCPLKCDFCATGTMRFEKNLTASEIIQQFYHIQKELNKNGDKITNLVYMGMGEPFLNYDNVIKSINLLNSKYGQNISKRNFTISTSGLVNEIRKIAINEKQIHLAISLHSVKQEIRNKLMPINKRYDLTELRKALFDYQKQTGNRITFEYILIDDMNIDRTDAILLTKFLKGFNALVNLIPYNPVVGKEYVTPSKTKQKDFFNYLKNNKINATLRETKGQDISAACGQLKVKKENQKNEKDN